ncbi:MAG: response regulator [Nitrospirae bacterium]|nr:response regulator [Nitrospirota bacterium]NTW66166.1 response regulator [Nitrospirota bacterium]
MNGEPLLILLVEDNLDHAELVRRSLAEHRIANRITVLTDGQSALDYLFRRGAFTDPASSPRPHIVLLDLRLPRVDGLDVLKAIKQDDDLHTMPVVVLTTSEAEQDIVAAYRHYVNSYLVKPVGYDDFNKLMQDFGFYWLGWNTNPYPEQQ